MDKKSKIGLALFVAIPATIGGLFYVFGFVAAASFALFVSIGSFLLAMAQD